MKILSGLPLIVAFNDQMNNRFGTKENPSFFTDTMEKLYEPMNDPNIPDREFLRNDMGDINTTTFMVQNVVNRCHFLDTFASLMPPVFQNAYLSNNDFRIQLLTTGSRVMVVKGRLVSFPCKKFTFPTSEDIIHEVDENEGLELNLNAPEGSEDGDYLLHWPGCSVVLPKAYKVRTVINPEISYPIFYTKDKLNNKTVNFFETNWGLNILKSNEATLKIAKNGEDRRDHTNDLRLSYSNDSPDDHGGYLNISAFLEEDLLNENSVLIFELPLRSPEQDILLKITDEQETEAPIFFTCCT